MRVVIVIPVYKSPDPWELVSLRRCCEVLSRYEMRLVCPQNLDVAEYCSMWNDYGIDLQIERFDTKWFQGISGYNRMLLSQEFYARFSSYEYMLIYQPDAYVFEDKLETWCLKGYDFIGAPLIGKFEDTVFHPEIMRVGNGGFSLRRIQTFLNYFSGKRNVIPMDQIADWIGLKKKVYTRWLIWILMTLGWRNRPKSFANQWKYNEDDFWSGVLTGSNYELTKPSSREAMDFAFERFPKELLDITGQLPFGCHAWLKYQYETFWKVFIKG